MLESDVVHASLAMDRGGALGNSEDRFGRRSIHTKIGNNIDSPVPVSIITEESTATTSSFVSSVGTSDTNVPATDGTNITDFFIRCPSGQLISNILSFSLDGTNFLTLSVGEAFSWSPHGGIKHIVIKGNVASVNYEIIMNRE